MRTEYEFPQRALHDRGTATVTIRVADLQTLRDSLAAQIDHAHAPQWINRTTCKTTGQRVLNRVDEILGAAGFPETDLLRGRYNVEASRFGAKRDWSEKYRGEMK